jgi:CrcB protein
VLGAGLLIGGALGAPLRYLVDAFVQERTPGVFPWGTFVVNVTGSLVLGVVAGLARYHGLGDVPVAVVGIGLCGGYTTFSTFSYETLELIEEGSIGLAAGNALGGLAVGLAAAAAGIAITAAF